MTCLSVGLPDDGTELPHIDLLDAIRDAFLCHAEIRVPQIEQMLLIIDAQNKLVAIDPSHLRISLNAVSH